MTELFNIQVTGFKGKEIFDIISKQVSVTHLKKNYKKVAEMSV